MKRLALASILISVGAYTACAVEEAPPPDNTGLGGAGNTAGVAGVGVGGTTGGTTAGTAGSGVGGTTGGTIATGGTTGGTIATGGTGGIDPMGMGGIDPMGMGGIDPMGMGGMPMGMGGMPMGMGGMPMGMGGMPMGMGGNPMGMGGMPMGMGGAGTGGGGACPECAAVATPLHGHTILMPCGMNTETRVCIPRADATKPCTDPGGTAASYSGAHSHNEQVTLGGMPGNMYRVTLHIRGMVEAKTYTGGTDRASSGTQVPADGLYTGGQANNSGNGYNIYFIRTDSPRQHYYLNSVGVGNDTRIRHSVFDVDMNIDIVAAGGSTVCMVSADPNTSAIKNCAEPDVGNVCNPVTLSGLDPLTTADIGTQPYNGQFVGITVVNTVRM